MNRTMLTSAIAAAAAAGALAFAAGPARAEGATMLKATMTGAAEVPGPGLKDGMGSASVAVYPARGYVCWSLSVGASVDSTMAHIHKGAAGVAGGVVVPLEGPGDMSATGCKQVDKALAADIAANPANYYVNVHNAAFPAGAIRGQLGM